MAKFLVVRQLPRLHTQRSAFERDWQTPWPRTSSARALIWRPQADVHEYAEQFVIKVELAGMRDAAIEVTLHDGVLYVSGQREEHCPSHGVHIHELGINYGHFELEFALRAPIDEAAISARYDDGMLLITLPKRNQAQAEPRRITIEQTNV